MKYGWLGWVPIIRELRQIREMMHHQLRELDRMRDILQLYAQDSVIASSARFADPRKLARYQAQVYSRHSEDGIIAEIFRRIGSIDRRFVEIGAGDGLENNTRLLLQLGWRGFWAEENPANVEKIREIFSAELHDGRLVLIAEHVARENIADLLRRAGVPAEFDFLSIDIDMNTSHVWRALSDFHPRAACIEYNAAFPPPWEFEVPYDPAGEWSDGSNYFGGSLKSLERIGAELGYNLVGCDFIGADAFFVRKDLCSDLFLEPFTAETHYQPPRYALHRRRGHQPHKRR